MVELNPWDLYIFISIVVDVDFCMLADTFFLGLMTRSEKIKIKIKSPSVSLKHLL